MHAGEQVRIDDVRGAACDDALLIGRSCVRFLGRDEGRADIGEVGTHRLRRQDRAAIGDRARQGEGAIEPLPDFLDQSEGRQPPGVPPGAGGDRDQTVRALFDRLVGEAIVDDVVQGDSAPSVDRLIELLARAERGNDDRHLPFGAGRQIGLEPIVGAVDDLIDGEGSGRRIRIGAVMRRQFLGDPVQPFVELALRPGVERREGADDARLALGDHQIGAGDDEERRTDCGQPEAIERSAKGHAGFIAKPTSLSSRRAWRLRTMPEDRACQSIRESPAA